MLAHVGVAAHGVLHKGNKAIKGITTTLLLKAEVAACLSSEEGRGLRREESLARAGWWSGRDSSSGRLFLAPSSLSLIDYRCGDQERAEPSEVGGGVRASRRLQSRGQGGVVRSFAAWAGVHRPMRLWLPARAGTEHWET